MAAKHSSYWLALFTVTSWEEFLAAGGNVVGFNPNKWSAAQNVKVGDKVLCYLTKVSAFVAVLEVTDKAYESSKRIWVDAEFPVRIPVKPLSRVPTAQSIQITALRGKLSIFKGLKNPNAWSIWVRSAPRLWRTEDGNIVEGALSAISTVDSETTIRRSKPRVKDSPAKSRSVRKVKSITGKTAVSRIVQKTAAIAADYDETIGPIEFVLSGNKVTGYSVNFPIWKTCKPTRVCSRYCYFAVGHNAWSNALKRQIRNLNTIQNNYRSFADRIALEYDKLDLNFIRWNGGGDPFPESVDAINYLAELRTDMKIWVVTRIPEQAAKIKQSPNVYIHFSLDRYSLKRRAKFESLNKASNNYFYSYQAEAGEMPVENNLRNVSVLFFDDYKPTGDYSWIPKEVVCPLNEVTDISNTCEACRRCFNDDASNHRIS